MIGAPTRDLVGRKILLIGIGFYDYEHSIAERLRERGAVLTAFEDLPPVLREGPLARIPGRMRALSDRLIARHERRILQTAQTLLFDQVLVIKGVSLRLPFLQALRKALPQAEFVLYQWDSLARLHGIEDRMPLFDRVLTFDRKDALSRPSMRFRPLFYREVPPSSLEPDIDVAFVGWLHSDRMASIRRMQADAQAQGLRTFVYLYTGWLTWLKLLLKGGARDVHPYTLPYGKLVRINARSRCIYDLPHALQAGLTMRSIEALGMRKKLLTTALDVDQYDFYSPANVRVIRPPASGLDRAFITSEPEPVPAPVLHRYSLDAWLDDVLSPGAPC